MKKTLAAVAVLGAFAGSAMAADVTLYGKVDLGLAYQNVENADFEAGNDSDSWGLESGQNSGSRFGIKGTEQIADGLTVGFQLEQGISADSGAFSDSDRAFNRESRLFVQTNYGEFGFGRMGTLDSGLGSYDIFGGDSAAFGTGWNGIGDNTVVFRGMGTRLDNMITYKSPTFAGMTVYGQVSLGTDSKADYSTTDGTVKAGKGEGSSDVNRYYSLGVTGEWGAASGALVVSSTDYNRTLANEPNGEDNSIVVSAYAAYDFGIVKTMLGAQYYDNMVQANVTGWGTNTGSTDIVWKGADLTKGYGVMLGATAPIASGTLYASIGYGDYEEANAPTDGSAKEEYDIWQVGVGYTYPLSKRTYLYTAVGYQQDGSDQAGDEDVKTTTVVAGMVHNF